MLISQRILFKKIVICPKGQFPKRIGAICNIPIETGNVCNTLPRSNNENHVLFVQLKRKLSFKYAVISEQVRSEKLLEVLSFLIENNHLYENVRISQDELPNDCEIDFSSDAVSESIAHADGIVFVDDNLVQMITPYENYENEFEKDTQKTMP